MVDDRWLRRALWFSVFFNLKQAMNLEYRGPDFFFVEGTWLRFFNEKGQLALLEDEFVLQLAETERLKAEAERGRAESERHRNEAAESELARLKTLLTEKGITPEC
jgi:hypothetical protein